MSLHTARRVEDVYQTEPDRARVRDIVAGFRERYGTAPEYLVRAPGRVNLIGEHVDYCGFPVLPISLQQDVVIAGGSDTSSTSLHIANLREGFPEFQCDIRHIELPELQWYSYVLAGYLGISERMNTLPSGLKLLVDGTVPMSAGLSSSSALVCASALLATLFLKDCSLSREAVAEVCARAERYVGTQGGGMDQAISFLGVAGSAQLISFNPVRCEPVSLPDTVTFVVANCMVNKWKADGTDFNNRVAECRLGTRVLSSKLKVDWKTEDIKTFHQLLKHKEMSPRGLLESVENNIAKSAYSKKEIMGLLAITEEEFSEIVGRSSNTEFRLYDRAVHVAGEAARVSEFRRICDEEPHKIEELGRLLDESHFSLRDKYNVSIDELDLLTQICRFSGALGSRLVGAGFGGCTISMVPKELVGEFLVRVWELYYKSRGLDYEAATQHHLFVTAPCDGACVMEL